MANELKMARVQAIIGLLERGWSYRRIARELGVHRDRVARYDRLRRAKPSRVTPGSGGEGESKPSKVTAGSGVQKRGKRSKCERFREVIEGKMEEGLTAQRIYQDLKEEHDFDGSYSSVKRYVRKMGGMGELPYRRMEVERGKEAQVDFCLGAPVADEEGRRRRVYVLRVVLSHSRKGYSEAVYRHRAENFIRVLENAFMHFGGVPDKVVIDNLRAAVKKANWFDPEINPKVMEFARHYGTVIIPTKPYTPRHKGKVESGVKYLKNNCLRGKEFTSLEEENEHLKWWEENVADTRIHGTTRKQVRKMFEKEKEALKPLPATRFPYYEEGKRKVHRDGHVEVGRAYYSVPPEYLGREVWVRWDSRVVRIYNHRLEQIAVHTKAGAGKFSTHPGHIDERKISGVERGKKHLLEKIDRMGPAAGLWARAVLSERGIEGIRTLVGFISLAKRYTACEINEAAGLALRCGVYRLRFIREHLKRRDKNSQDKSFTQHHELIRPLSEYGDYVKKQP